MKIIYGLMFLSVFAFMPSEAYGATLAQQLSGRIVLQVQANGEAWYVSPTNNLRYFLGRPNDAFQVMRKFGLGISETDFNSFKNNSPLRLLGRIMLRVHANGEAYYVDPISKKFVFLGRPSDAFRIMREKGLGINNENISHMPISGDSIIPPGEVMNITVINPKWNDSIVSPMIASGTARVFENSVNIRLRNSQNKILADKVVIADSPDVGEYGPYNLSFIFSAPGTTSGFLEVFTISAKDGTEIDKVITLVRF